MNMDYSILVIGTASSGKKQFLRDIFLVGEKEPQRDEITYDNVWHPQPRNSIKFKMDDTLLNISVPDIKLDKPDKEAFRKLLVDNPSYINIPFAILLTYDVREPKSYHDVDEWLKVIRSLTYKVDDGQGRGKDFRQHTGLIATNSSAGSGKHVSLTDGKMKMNENKLLCFHDVDGEATMRVRMAINSIVTEMNRLALEACLDVSKIRIRSRDDSTAED